MITSVLWVPKFRRAFAVFGGSAACEIEAPCHFPEPVRKTSREFEFQNDLVSERLYVAVHPQAKVSGGALGDAHLTIATNFSWHGSNRDSWLTSSPSRDMAVAFNRPFLVLWGALHPLHYDKLGHVQYGVHTAKGIGHR